MYPDCPFTFLAMYVSVMLVTALLSLSSQRLSESAVADFRAPSDAQEIERLTNTLNAVTGECSSYNFYDSATLDDGWTDACRWIDGRRKLSTETGQNQLRLYSVYIYTDDPIFIVGGKHRQIASCHAHLQPSYHSMGTAHGHCSQSPSRPLCFLAWILLLPFNGHRSSRPREDIMRCLLS
jgi:hypothetical protein